jgi:hypothetical protein
MRQKPAANRQRHAAWYQQFIAEHQAGRDPEGQIARRQRRASRHTGWESSPFPLSCFAASFTLYGATKIVASGTRLLAHRPASFGGRVVEQATGQLASRLPGAGGSAQDASQIGEYFAAKFSFLTRSRGWLSISAT